MVLEDPKRSKTTILIHPVLFAVIPVFSIYAHNASELIFRDLFQPLGIMLGITLILLALSALIFRDIEKAAIFASSILFSAVLYGHLYMHWHHQFQIAGFEIMRHGILLPAYLLMLAALFLTLFFTQSCLSGITKLFFLFSLCFTLFSLVQIGYAEWGKITYPHTNTPVATEEATAKVPLEELPDIYYLLPDRYPREDFLRENLDFDNTEFIRALEKRNFFVPKKNTSNYSATSLSVASTLNMDYVQNLIKEMPQSYDLTPLAYLIKENKVIQFLKSHDYEFIAFKPEYSFLNYFTKADRFLSHGWVPNQITGQLYELTPLPGASKLIAFFPKMAHENHRQKILWDLGQFAQLAAEPPSSKPRFIFLYLMCPHEPFVFGENGEPVETSKIFTIKPLFTDALKVAYTPATADWDVFQEKHNLQLIFLNKMILEAVDQILADSAKPPIIIIQSDHGINVSPPSNSVKNFLALHLPDFPRKELDESISAVNIFRLIFNFYLKGNFPLLKDKQYYPFHYYTNPYDLTEITESI